MLLNSVILLLQEALEAALLMSVLIAVSKRYETGISWLIYGIIAGVSGACLYAFNISHISGWFDYAGQEVVNALLQLVLAVSIAIYTVVLLCIRQSGSTTANRDSCISIYTWSASCIIAIAIMREGAEILLYIGGFFKSNHELAAVLLGSSIGLGIGLSIGIILFFALISIPGSWHLRVVVTLLAFFAGNMTSQSALLLTQADWIPAGPVLWDSSGILSESSVTGRLFYAVLGYEATPSLVQCLGYILGMAIVTAALYMGWYKQEKGSKAREIH